MRWKQIAAWARLPFEAAFLGSSRSDVDSERGGGAVRAASFTSDLLKRRGRRHTTQAAKRSALIGCSI